MPGYTSFVSTRMNEHPKAAATTPPRVRTPAEIMYTRCMYTLVAWLIPMVFVYALLAYLLLEKKYPPNYLILPAGVAVYFFPLAVWIRALISLMRVWQDSSAKLLRVCAVLVLLVGLCPTLAVIFAPLLSARIGH